MESEGAALEIHGEAQKTVGDFRRKFAAGLCAIGIPVDRIVQYEEVLTKNKWLLFVNVAVNEIDRAHPEPMETNPTNGTLHHGADSKSDEKQERG